MKKGYQNWIVPAVSFIYTMFVLVPAAHALTVPDIQQYSGTNIDIVTIIKNIGTWMIGLAGALAVVYLIYGGIRYITGGAKAETEAKVIIINSIIGIVVVILSAVIINTVLMILGLA